MPTYDYKCPKCHKKEERTHGVYDPTTYICTNCIKNGDGLIPMVKGVGGGIATHFKGNGFYETDYKNKK